MHRIFHLVLFTMTIATLVSCADSEGQNDGPVEYLKNNYSYEWPKISESPVGTPIFNKCQEHYANELRGTDVLVLKRLYLVQYNGQAYFLVEYDFKKVLDKRLIYVWNKKTSELIGHFERSLA